MDIYTVSVYIHMLGEIRMNKFYTIPLGLQWLFAVLLAFIGGMPFGLTFYFSIFKSPAFLFLLPIVFSLSFFSITPILKLIGYFSYYSPMLLATKDKNKIELHNGTSFDYLCMMKISDFGYKAQKKMLIYYLEGLLNLISEIEKGKLSMDVNIEGASYFFSKNTVRRLGFTVVKPKIVQRIKTTVNFFDLFWMYSYAKGKIVVPNVLLINRASINGKDLLNQKNYIETLLIRLRNITSPNKS